MMDGILYWKASKKPMDFAREVLLASFRPSCHVVYKHKTYQRLLKTSSIEGGQLEPTSRQGLPSRKGNFRVAVSTTSFPPPPGTVSGTVPKDFGRQSPVAYRNHVIYGAVGFSYFISLSASLIPFPLPVSSPKSSTTSASIRFEALVEFFIVLSVSASTIVFTISAT